MDLATILNPEDPPPPPRPITPPAQLVRRDSLDVGPPTPHKQWPTQGRLRLTRDQRRDIQLMFDLGYRKSKIADYIGCTPR